MRGRNTNAKRSASGARRWAAIAAGLCVGVVLVVAPVRAGDAGGGDGFVSGEAALLPKHDKALTGTLANGLAYVVLRHGEPMGEVSVVLRVAVGSLHEDDAQRGASRIAQQFLMLGDDDDDNRERADARAQLRTMGIIPERHAHSSSAYDQTLFQLHIPSAHDDALRAALDFFKHFSEPLTPGEARLDSVRRLIRERERGGDAVSLRLFESVLPKLVPDSRLAERLPRGGVDALDALMPGDVQVFHDRWYTPGNMLVVVVGDVDSERAQSLIEGIFSVIPARTSPPAPTPGVAPPGGRRAIVTSDPALPAAIIDVISVVPSDGVVATLGDFEDLIVEQVAVRALEQRLARQISEGRFAGDSARVWSNQPMRGVRAAGVSVRSADGEWQPVVEGVYAELERIRRHGLTDAETDEAMTLFLSDVRTRARTEQTMPSDAMARNIAAIEHLGMALLSGKQELAFAERIACSIGPRSLSRRLATLLDPDTSAVVVLTPEARAMPRERELLEIIASATAQQLEPLPQRAMPRTILDVLPPKASVAELRLHPRAGVLTATMHNGVVMHHREMRTGQSKETVQLRITLAGGRIEETAQTRGLTNTMELLWFEPAARSRAASSLRSILAEHSVTLAGDVGEDHVSIRLSCERDTIEYAMGIVHLLLTEPVYEPGSFARWRSASTGLARAREQYANMKAFEVFLAALYPKNDPRHTPLRADEIESITHEAAQEWLDRMVTSAPVEVAVVGDISRERAVELTAQYLGTIAPRQPVARTTLDALRDVPFPCERVDRRVNIETPNLEQAVVLAGFRGADEHDYADARMLEVAAHVLTSRLLRRLRNERQLVDVIRATSEPARAYSGFGRFWIVTVCDPVKVDLLASSIDEAVAMFAAYGPTEDELSQARRGIALGHERALDNPSRWALALATFMYHDRDLDAMLDAPDVVRACEAEQVREIFRTYAAPDRRIKIVIEPGAVPPATD